MDEEEWFFNSFKRYNELQMFDFPRNVADIDLTSSKNLCVALAEDSSHKNEILIFQLPSALQPKSTSGFTKLERHLSFDHGYFTESPLVQMKCTYQRDNLIISERNGVALFDLTSDDSDIIRKVSSIPGEVESALITVNPSKPYVVLCDGQIGHRSVVDYESMKAIFRSDLDDSAKESIIPMFSSTDIVSFGMTDSGSVVSYDIRDGKQTNTLYVKGLSSTANQWIFKSSFECCSEPTNANFLYTWADDGLLMLFDWRNTSEAAQRAVFSVSKASDPCSRHMSVSPSNPNHLALSGLDETVYVCDIRDNQVIPVFAHDGHAYCHNEYESNVRSIRSKWLPFISSSTLVSCASNASLQCWQFKIS